MRVVAAPQRRAELGRRDHALERGAVGAGLGRALQLHEQLAGVHVRVPRRRDARLLRLDAVQVADPLQRILGPRDLAVVPFAHAPEAGHLHDRERLVTAGLEPLARPAHPHPLQRRLHLVVRRLVRIPGRGPSGRLHRVSQDFLRRPQLRGRRRGRSRCRRRGRGAAVDVADDADAAVPCVAAGGGFDAQPTTPKQDHDQRGLVIHIAEC